MWEYKIVIGDVNNVVDIETLNALGLEGWELITHNTTPSMSGLVHEYIFKRERGFV